MYSERQKKLYIKKFTLINYRYFYIKIISLPVFKIEAKKITKNFEIISNFFNFSIEFVLTLTVHECKTCFINQLPY